MEEEEGYESAKTFYLALEPLALKKSGRYPRREELYDRPGIR
jgi:hypothetical protein